MISNHPGIEFQMCKTQTCSKDIELLCFCQTVGEIYKNSSLGWKNIQR